MKRHPAPPALLLLAALVIWVSVTPRTQRVAASSSGSAPERIWANTNREPAGDLENGVLTLWLEARDGVWYPEGPEGMAYAVAAFAEEGGPLLNPGPLIRVPVGTEIRVRLRNSLAQRLRVFGLTETRGALADSIVIEPGGVQETRFVASLPGTYWYAGRTDTSDRPTVFARRQSDSQLNGVIVVDPPGTGPRPGERIFLISWWLAVDSQGAATSNRASTLAINGLSWPHTEQLDVAQGDSLYWRWVSMTAAPHPMHLHGFYFRVDAKGNGAQDTSYTPELRRLAVTEVLRAGQTMSIAWSPERPGNWVFHCHLTSHITRGVSEDGSSGEPAQTTHNGADPTQHAMSRLVLGIRVKPRGKPAAASAKYRPMRLEIRSRPGVYGDRPGYGYVLGSQKESNPAALPVPGALLVLKKGEPVAITVVNRSHEAAAVHWHGIELESYPDGVPGWSGSGNELLPAIRPGDSLTVRFTPPRAGTFMYHSHFNELQQISSGLYGAIVVLEPGQHYDAETDRVLLFSDPGPANPSVGRIRMNPLLNGTAQMPSLTLRAGVQYRFRVINIRSNAAVGLELMRGDRPLEWRLVAKDGADLPAPQAVVGSAYINPEAGEIYDFEFTPPNSGMFTLRYGFPAALRPPARPPAVPFPPPIVVPVHVK